MRRTFLFLLVFVICVSLGAQEKYALVIGNANYKNFDKLNNPINDANDIAAILDSLGFKVDKLLDANRVQMEDAVDKLRRRLEASPDSYGFFYYAGHGVQSRTGKNYLIPYDAEIRSENLLAERAVAVDYVLAELEDAKNELNMIVLDACRDFPVAWNRSGGSRGFSQITNPPRGSIIMYATAAGATADEGEGRNGLFTSQLLKNLATTTLSVRDIFDKTGDDVFTVSAGTQHPAISINYFRSGSTYLGSLPPGFTITGETSPNLNFASPPPKPLPAKSKQTTGGAVGYGFMNLAFGLGSYLQGDIPGGVIVTGGYAAALGLIAWEFSLSRGDAMAGIIGPIGVGVGAATIIFGFVKPIIYNSNRRLASAVGNLDVALVSSEQNKKTLAIKYTHSF